jgi:hypothetical protein
MLVKSILNGGDIQYMIENMSDLNLTRPIDPTRWSTSVQGRIMEKAIRPFLEMKRNLL